jgi:hypothetical protein
MESCSEGGGCDRTGACRTFCTHGAGFCRLALGAWWWCLGLLRLRTRVRRVGGLAMRRWCAVFARGRASGARSNVLRVMEDGFRVARVVGVTVRLRARGAGRRGLGVTGRRKGGALRRCRAGFVGDRDGAGSSSALHVTGRGFLRGRGALRRDRAACVARVADRERDRSPARSARGVGCVVRSSVPRVTGADFLGVVRVTVPGGSRDRNEVGV